MAYVTIRELRNRGGVVVERVIAGEVLTVTRDGQAVARLQPVAPTPMAAEAIVDRRRHLPAVDPHGLRSDIDRVADPSL